MNTEQVNVQELQRLNEAITLTMDAIRRTAPQLSQLQQQVLLSGITPGVGFGAMMQPGLPAVGSTVDPLTANYLHAQQLQQAMQLQQMMQLQQAQQALQALYAQQAMRGISPLAPTGGFMPGVSALPFGVGAPTPWPQPYGYSQRIF